LKDLDSAAVRAFVIEECARELEARADDPLRRCLFTSQRHTLLCGATWLRDMLTGDSNPFVESFPPET
jgi:hypothetical protein